MKIYKFQIILFLSFIFILNGCLSRTQNLSEQKENILPVRIVAVFPVQTKNDNSKTPEYLRKKINDELYFRGYATIPLEILDKKLTDSSSQIQFDAAMQCKLVQDDTKKGLLYSPIVIEASCELRQKITGELLWKGQAMAKSHNFDFTPKRVERKTYEDYENVISEVVNQLLEKIPDGPILR